MINNHSSKFYIFWTLYALESKIDNRRKNMENVVETFDLSKRYNGRFVVDHVNIHIPAGSVYGFVGENGSGKTTIMRLLMGLANPTEGSYKLFDLDNNDRHIYEVRKKISAIVEAPSLVPTMTAKQNLKYACLYYGIKDADQVIEESLRSVGLGDTGKKKVKNFSLGMRQRLGIAILLLNKPELMFLDEPMNGLDPSGVAELRDLIIELNKKGITFLISSHILSELEKVATTWGFISHGKLLQEISASDLAAHCDKSTELRAADIHALEEAVKAIGITNYVATPVSIKIKQDVNPTQLLTSLAQKGVAVTDISTTGTSVEEYYLNLIGGKL